MSTLRYGEIFDKAWSQMRDRLPLVAGLSVLYFLAAGVMSSIHVFGAILSGFIHVGYIVCLIQIRDKNEMSYADFFWAFADANRLLQLAFFYLVYYFLIVGGCILLLVPGIYLIVALSLASSYFVTRKQDAIESIKASIRLLNNHWWNMAGLLFMIALLNLAGAMCLLVGLLFSLPMSVYILLIALDTMEKNEVPPTSVRSDVASTSVSVSAE